MEYLSFATGIIAACGVVALTLRLSGAKIAFLPYKGKLMNVVYFLVSVVLLLGGLALFGDWMVFFCALFMMVLVVVNVRRAYVG